jgi:hypothetical protein
VVAVREELSVVARVRRWLKEDGGSAGVPGIRGWSPTGDPPRADLRCLERRLSALRREFPDLEGVSASEHLRDAWNRYGE